MNKKNLMILGIILVLLSGCGAKKDKAESTLNTVIIQKLKPQQAVNRQQFSGIIQPVNTATVVNQSSGVIEKILVEVGDDVQQGQLLAQIDGDVSKATYASAEIAFKNAQLAFERQSVLYKEGVISKQQYENAQAQLKQTESNYALAKKNYDNCNITSPIKGSVAERFQDAGSFSGKDKELFTIVDYDTVNIPIGVTEREIVKIKKGDAVQITIDVLPGMVFTGRIHSVGVMADSHTGSYPVVVRANNSRHYFKPGMVARAGVVLENINRARVVDMDTLISRGEERGVFTVDDQAVAHYIPVEVAFEFGSKAALVNGPDFGQMIVVRGHKMIVDGEKVVTASEGAQL